MIKEYEVLIPLDDENHNYDKMIRPLYKESEAKLTMYQTGNIYRLIYQNKRLNPASGKIETWSQYTDVSEYVFRIVKMLDLIGNELKSEVK